MIKTLVVVAALTSSLAGAAVAQQAPPAPPAHHLPPHHPLRHLPPHHPLRHLPPPRFIAETARGVRMMRAAGIDVILMEPQWCRRLRETAGSRAYTLAVRAVAASFGVPVVRRHALMQVWLARGLLTPAQMLAPDGLHMTDGGYAMLARVVAKDILGAEPAAAATPRLIAMGARPVARPGARPVAP